MQEVKLIKKVLDLYITDYCNMNCKHCYNDVKIKKKLNIEQIKTIINKTEKFYKNELETINLLGGEPFSHEEFYSIIKYCSKFAKVNTSTNATYILNTPIKILSKLNYIQLSVESMKEEIADYYREKGFYRNLIKSAEYLNNNNIKFGFKITVTKDNFENIEKDFYEMKELGAKKVSLSRMIPIGNGEKIRNKLITDKEFEIVVKKALLFMIKNNIEVDMSDGIWTCLVDEKLGKFKNQKLEKGGCSAGLGGITIIPNGDIMICRRLPIVIGNIFKCKDIADIYYDNELVKNLYNRNFSGKCGRCNKKQVCGGGCRAYVMATKENALADDDLCFLSN